MRAFRARSALLPIPGGQHEAHGKQGAEDQVLEPGKQERSPRNLRRRLVPASARRLIFNLTGILVCCLVSCSRFDDSRAQTDIRAFVQQAVPPGVNVGYRFEGVDRGHSTAYYYVLNLQPLSSKRTEFKLNSIPVKLEPNSTTELRLEAVFQRPGQTQGDTWKLATLQVHERPPQLAVVRAARSDGETLWIFRIFRGLLSGFGELSTEDDCYTAHHRNYLPVRHLQYSTVGFFNELGCAFLCLPVFRSIAPVDRHIAL